jgi:shikimate kinase / 3-dehydroquinate synthase
MDLVLVGLSGGGKTSIGRRLARRHGATFVDLDDAIAEAAGRPVPAIFEEEGETGFRARERAAIATLGPADADLELSRVISTGGGAVVDPRNRWALYRSRRVAWLDAPPEVLAQRVRNSPAKRPLVAGRDPVLTMRAMAAARSRFYGPGLRVNAIVGLNRVIASIEEFLDEPLPAATLLLRADTALGHYELGDGNAVDGVVAALAALGARRAIFVSEPVAWDVAGAAIADAVGRTGLPLEHLLLPTGEAAKTLAVIEEGARSLARLRAERTDPIVAVGGGALGDAAGFLAATWLRGVPLVHVPTTLVAQVDSSIGGKTAVDLPEGKNLVGSFHQPAANVTDVRLLRTLPPRQLRGALGEVVKMAALGDERLFELLEESGPAIAAADVAAFDSGAVAEVVERCAWAKIEVVTADEHEHGGRISLNLGHSLAHGIEAAAGYEGILHGEAVAYGLRAACRIGVAVGVTPPERAVRVEALLDRLDLGAALTVTPEAALAAMATDKKTLGGRLRWVLPTSSGWVARSDIPADLVAATARDVLAGRPAGEVSR